MKKNIGLIISLFLVSFTPLTYALDWSKTELHLANGKIETPQFLGGGSASTTVITLQHASGWKYGDNFFFIDYLDSSENKGFNDNDYYGEVYLNFSLNKIMGFESGLSLIRDVGVVAGINMARDAKVVKYLPGIRLSWNLPGFAFLNSDFTAYLDNSKGASGGGAPSENDSTMIDVNWAYPLSFGAHNFSIEGHIEYIGERVNEFGGKVSDWVLAQPQFRYDLGKTLFDVADKFFVGIEYQFWMNKLGDERTDENEVQVLFVLRI
ncbi:MAG: nucleoside-binding protein [Methylococcales bacterium]|nr:nucleoside-binding protein [Methylococcales bacterium]MBT7409999.1 nucleoside-binding protein [Methylococcales bacterium]